MEINKTTILDDRGFIYINGKDAKEFLQNIVTNDINKVTNTLTIFSSILTPQGKYLFEFFILKFKEGYLLECEGTDAKDIIKILDFYKLRSKVNFTNISNKNNIIIISLEKFKEITKSESKKGFASIYNNNLIYIDPRNESLGARIVSEIESNEDIFKNLSLQMVNKKNYYNKSFELGIPQINLNKLKDKIFGIENNLAELGGIDFKKGCYIGQENTSRIKLRNKLRRRILPIHKISGKISENDIIKYKNIEIGKIIINEPYPFALIKVIDPDLKEFNNIELICGESKIKIIKPNWI